MPQPLSAFAGKTALVSGAGDGIGAMLARQFAHAGMNVLVQDIRADAAERVAREIGVRAQPIVFDVSDRDAVAAAASDLGARGVSLNLLWINAGVAPSEAILTAPANTLAWAYGVNVLGAIWTAQAFAPLLMGAEGPRHVGFTASVAALRVPGGAFTLYAATKQASLGVAEALRRELAESGVVMTILCPGLFASNIWNGVRARPDRFGGAAPMREDTPFASRWRDAKDPVLMWPHIVRAMESGGGYCVCTTDGGATRAAIAARMDEVAAAILEL